MPCGPNRAANRCTCGSIAGGHIVADRSSADSNEVAAPEAIRSASRRVHDANASNRVITTADRLSAHNCGTTTVHQAAAAPANTHPDTTNTPNPTPVAATVRRDTPARRRAGRRAGVTCHPSRAPTPIAAPVRTSITPAATIAVNPVTATAPR